MNRRVFFGLYKAETPIQHQADERMETTTIFRYNEVILSDGKKVKVYNISAASFRNVIRRHAAYRLFDLCEVKLDDLPEISNVVLLSGGPRMDKSKGGGKKIAQGLIPVVYSNAICAWFPMLSLLGCTSQFCMVPHDGSKLSPTSLNVLAAELQEFMCEKAVIKHHKVDVKSLPKACTEFQFNAKFDTRTKYDPTEKSDSDCGTVKNVFDVQYVCKGTLFGNMIAVQDFDDGMLSSCLSSALSEWTRRGNYIAGKKANGAGVLTYQFDPKLPPVDLYENFVTANKENLQKMILDANIWKDPDAIKAYGEPKNATA